MYLTYALSPYLYKFIAGAYSKQIGRLGECAACSFSYVIARGPRRVLSSIASTGLLLPSKPPRHNDDELIKPRLRASS